MTTTIHPCYSPQAAVSHGRIHLPIARECNIQCKYCNRLYDCVNESRPGVTSVVLTPMQAIYYLEKVIPLIDCKISVVGIAGPGDPFAEPDNTIETLKLVKEKYPEMITCVASNGLNLAEYATILSGIGVEHVTVTINAIDPEITAKIISWVRFRKKIYRGIDAGKMLLERQLLAVSSLKQCGINVKINSIVIPGINENHIVEVSKEMRKLNVDVMNCLPLHPVNDTEFANLSKPDHELMQKVRWEVSDNVTVVHHCAMCRADAAGRLGNQNNEMTTKLLKEISKMPNNPIDNRPNIAVASKEGILVNEHLGRADQFYIYNFEDTTFPLIEIRKAPACGTGTNRWLELAEILRDCKILLVHQTGEPPREVLAESGIRVITTEGLIDQALTALSSGYDPVPVVNVQSCNGGGCNNKPCG